MSQLISAILIIIAVISQNTLFPQLNFGRSFPNLVLVIILILFFIEKRDLAWYWALFGGLFLDLLSGSIIGNYSIGLILVCLILSFLTERLLESRAFFLESVIVFFSSILFYLTIFGFNLISGLYLISLENFVVIFLSSLLNVLLFTVMYHLIYWLDQKYFHQDKLKIGV